MIHHDTPPNLGVLGVFYFQTKPKKELLACGRSNDASVPEKYDQFAYLEHNCTGNFMIECRQ